MWAGLRKVRLFPLCHTCRLVWRRQKRQIRNQLRPPFLPEYEDVAALLAAGVRVMGEAGTIPVYKEQAPWADAPFLCPGWDRLYVARKLCESPGGTGSPPFPEGLPPPTRLPGASFQLGTVDAGSILTDVLSPGLCPIFTTSLELDRQEVP